MAWTIEFKGKFSKFISKQEKDTQERVRISLNKLLDYLNSGVLPFDEMDIKQLHGKAKGFMRLRIGKIRIIFKINIELKILGIHAVDYRGGIYR